MNKVQLTDPFALDLFDDDWRQMLRPWRFAGGDIAPRIKLDLSEHEDSYMVKAEIPGVRKQDIDVRIDGNQVTISAEVKRTSEDKEGGRVLRSERQTGMASRSFTLASAVDESKAQAHYDSGILSLMLPKKAGAGSRRLTVQ